jgi:putative nucleotidyltransferase with HDIG domain
MFGVLVLHTRDVVRGNVIENLENGQRLLAVFESQRQQETNLQASVLTESPTLKAALDTFFAERRMSPDEAYGEQARETVGREVAKLAGILNSDVVAVTEPSGTLLASAGGAAALWIPGRRVHLPRPAGGDVAFDQIVSLGTDRFRVTAAPIWLGDTNVGLLVVGTRVDDAYAAQLAGVLRTNIAVLLDDGIVATTLAPEVRMRFEQALTAALGDSGTLDLDGEPFAYRRLHRLGPASIYAMDSIADATSRISRAAVPKLAGIAVGAFLLSACASLWLARSTAGPINWLSNELHRMARSPQRGPALQPTGSSAEVDGLVATFNDLLGALDSARAETEAAYVGAIRALAAALDARDAYTAGHSERVSALSVAIGRRMTLPAGDLDVLRLGALLHDIGKIGIGDAILCKPSRLSDEEFRIIKTHPSVGAQILRSIAFLEPHIPIVELHHEQPDGGGYPHGLPGRSIPLLASIVHVADAFDAMTTARAYREGRPAAEAMAELWRYAGTQFDAEVVAAFAAELPAVLAELHTRDRQGTVIPFHGDAQWA